MKQKAPLFLLRGIALLLILTLSVFQAEAKKRSKEPAPRNLIYMIGDGMGLSHVAMMLIEQGYTESAFDRMENVALCTTYSANNRVTDSAAAGTALATGHKTDNGMLGVTPDGTPVESIISRAIRAGWHTGIVVTSEIQHATPGAFYAHVSHRSDYPAISRQLVDSELEVAFGGGRTGMTTPTAEGPTPEQLLAQKGYRIIHSLDQAESIDEGLVMGFLAEGHLPSKLEGRDNYLTLATEKALQLLTRNSEKAGRKGGIMLMVEASQIDMESHGNNTAGILAETRDFEQAIAAAMRYVDAHPETLLVVTADHETGGLTMPSGNSDFTSSESGIEYRYSTGSHTGILVPVYLYGCGAERINGVMDNTELSHRLMELMGVNE